MISPMKISYNGFSSVDFPTFTLLTDVAFNSDNGEINTYLSRDAVASESFSGKIKNVSNYKYTENLTPKITLVKEGFGDFSFEETRKVLSWLTSKDTPSFLDVYDDVHSEAALYSVLGAFTSVQSYKLANNRTVGFVAEFTSVSPFAYSPINTYQRTITEPTTFTVTCDNDDTAYVYPRVTVKHNGTSIEIKNSTTNTITAVRNSVAGETVIIDGANQLIYSSRTNRTFSTDFGTDDIHNQWVWLPLTDGENTITVTGNCDLTFEWREVRKIGEF